MSILPKAWESLLNSSNLIPVVVRSVERFYDTSWIMEPNRHEVFEMVYIKRGNAVFEISGDAADIGPNNIVIIKPRQPHKFIVKSGSGCEFIVFNFKFENRLNNEVAEVSLEDFLNFLNGKETGHFIKLKVSARNDIIVLLERILEEKKNNDIGSEFLRYLLMLELFVLLSRSLKMEWENSIMGKSGKLNEVIEAAVSFINNNYERNITLSDISRYVFLSRSYFAKAFKEIKGVSPIHYLLRIRVERAGELLVRTNRKVSDIAFGVGFSNQQRFNEIFKKYTGMTPLQCRKFHRKD
ncbi:MAG: AraC family transcriptional regulator [Clostridiaceae bacterium]|nr:AraC family transcriptional regulator [Clostridiaceae bacterium]